MYKVFINNFPIFLAQTSETINSKLPVVDINCHSEAEAKKIIDQHLSSNGEKCYIARNNNIHDLWNYFFGKYLPVKAAGGLVLNPENEMLFILRNNKWDLPKGKIDPGEDEETAALREVEEECGIRGHVITRKITDTFHTYPLPNAKVIKTTSWFEMKLNKPVHLTPQTEEGITQVCWKNKYDLPEILKNTYGSIEDVLNAAKI
jgi:8-oxo-dGTP pyrophosphatase MutT (NUDIX family)